MENISTDSDDLDNKTYYVRVTGVRNKRFVEFDFSINDPALYVELVLPFKQYKLFCKKHNAQSLTSEQEAEVDLETLKWRYGSTDASVVYE